MEDRFIFQYFSFVQIFPDCGFDQTNERCCAQNRYSYHRRGFPKIPSLPLIFRIVLHCSVYLLSHISLWWCYIRRPAGPSWSHRSHHSKYHTCNQKHTDLVSLLFKFFLTYYNYKEWRTTRYKLLQVLFV
eukprot:NODE_16_length_49026_cov_1.035992.p23 type:complete len:130 gc:universal NODE_16_length_49026_cov_1.035992:43890-43501(-)